MNNINGGPGRRSGMASVDFYRRVPKDLTEVRSYFYAARHVVEAVMLGRGYPLSIISLINQSVSEIKFS